MYKKLTLYSRDTSLIQKKAIQLLKVNDLGELRDKFEGVSFYNKLSLKLYSIIALERYLGINILNIEELDSINFKNDIVIDAIRISIISFNYDDPPIVTINEINSSVLTMYKEPRSIFLYGYISKNDLGNTQNLKKCDSPVWKDRYEFRGFEKIKMFDDLKQLVELYNEDI